VERAIRAVMTSEISKKRWLGYLGLPASNWKPAVRAHLATLRFCDRESGQLLIEFLLGKLPVLLHKHPSHTTAVLAEAFGWACLAFWQCGSSFPSFPENYAQFLHDQLLLPAEKRAPVASVIAGLILGQAGTEKTGGACGFNQLKLDEPQLVRDSEQVIHEGRYEDYLKAGEKYEEYEMRLRVSSEFQADWQQIKTTFRSQVQKQSLVHRTLIPERNWERGDGASFKDIKGRFQAVFDLFCWKYYLWGMKGDEPLLLKASVVFTPFGTQIFIPGYLSFDPKRDLDFGKITQLHRARGIQRQGPGFSIGRKELAELKLKAKVAFEEAKRRKLKGDKRYEFVCGEIDFSDSVDYRRLRRLLE
jgi:hypothetical protein